MSDPEHRRLRDLIVLTVAMLAVGLASVAASVIYANVTAHRLDVQAKAACGFAADLGSVPFPASPKPSKLGVSLVVDSRAQWRALHCPGPLPPPSPGLVHWAKFYRIPVS